MGLILMALIAGSVPAAEPRMKNVPTIAKAPPKLISKPALPSMGSAVRWSAKPRIMAAKHTPAVPATSVSSTLSLNTCTVMSAGFAPMALRTPNSWVRSFTMIHMILPTPITPAISEPMPTKAASMAMPMKRPLIISNISDMSINQKARSSSGCMECRPERKRRMAGSFSEGL